MGTKPKAHKVYKSIQSVPKQKHPNIYHTKCIPRVLATWYTPSCISLLLSYDLWIALQMTGPKNKRLKNTFTPLDGVLVCSRSDPIEARSPSGKSRGYPRESCSQRVLQPSRAGPIWGARLIQRN